MAAAYDVDGYLDVVFSNNNQLQIAYGSASGTFAAIGAAVANSDANAVIQQVAVADLNHEGRPKIVVCWNDPSAATGTLSIYNVGAQRNVAPSAQPSYTLNIDCRGLVLTDLNNDKRTDVVTVSPTSNTVTFLTNTTTALSSYSVIHALSGLAKPTATVAADINRHGTLDYLISQAGSPATRTGEHRP